MHVSSPTGVLAIDPHEIEAEYERRGLANWSDDQLIGAVAAVVAEPRQYAADSFVLHAPLELAARAALLPHLLPDHRERARRRIVALASNYESYACLAADDAQTHTEGERADDGIDAVRRLTDAIAVGDVDAAGFAAVIIAATKNRADTVASLAGPTAPLTSAAAHGPIFLHHLARRDVVSPMERLLCPLARELARNPTWRIRWTDSWRPSSETDAFQLRSALAHTPPLGAPAVPFVHPIVMQVDSSGVASELLGSVVGTRSDAAANAVLRIAAWSMLLDDPQHAAFGWSHCLTIPQAILSTTRGSVHADHGLALAATHVAAFRAALGSRELPVEPRMAFPEVDVALLASQACMFEEAHIVKYVLACIDAAHDDPGGGSLYLAAGRRLVDLWSGQPPKL